MAGRGCGIVVVGGESYPPSVRRTHRQGQAHDESTPAGRRELGADLAAMQLHDLAADVQAQSQPAAVIAAMGLVEALEDLPALLRRDPQPVVPHRQLDAVAGALHEDDLDRTAVRTV